ncbi:MAG: hypothetical protein CM15mP3_03150 [Candidatus Poseidoniales archaeon]|nr:MAG: hypothetical protein CM15mP3_03150 [Candidatus Poseidoniales archaeon]
MPPVEARSGPACLTDGLGDCDDQTNAYLSLLRTKGIPGWYVLGALTDENTITGRRMLGATSYYQ